MTAEIKLLLLNQVLPGIKFKLSWKEYPAYVDKERTVVAESQVMLYATAYVRKAKSKKTESSLLDFLPATIPEKAG